MSNAGSKGSVYFLLIPAFPAFAAQIDNRLDRVLPCIGRDVGGPWLRRSVELPGQNFVVELQNA